jgi:hypothetical protein
VDVYHGQVTGVGGQPFEEFGAVAGRVHHLHARHAGNHFLQTVDEKLVIVGNGYSDGQRHSGRVYKWLVINDHTQAEAQWIASATCRKPEIYVARAAPDLGDGKKAGMIGSWRPAA